MIDVEILTSLEKFEDEEQAKFSLRKITESTTITLEEAKILINLLVPFFKSTNSEVQKLAEKAYDFLKGNHEDLEMPEEMLDTSLGARKLKREFVEFKKQRTAEMEALKATELAEPGKPAKKVVPPWEKTKIRTEKACFWEATKAMEAGDYEEAEKNFTLTLQFNDERGDAWLGKGIAIGLKEDSPLYRVEEVLGCFKKAFKYGLKEKKELEEASKSLNSIAVGIFKQTIIDWEAHQKKKELRAQNPGAAGQSKKEAEFNEEIVIPAEKSVEALLFAWKLHGAFDVAKNLVFATHILSGIGFLNDEKKTIYQKLHDQYQFEARKFDPTFEMGKATPRRCFVVTATMGGENNEFVETLTEFRDRVLSETLLGRQAIALYYQIGPALAEVISTSTLCKTLAFHALVKPASKIARAFLARKVSGPFRKRFR